MIAHFFLYAAMPLPPLMPRLSVYALPPDTRHTPARHAAHSGTRLHLICPSTPLPAHHARLPSSASPEMEHVE